MEAEETLARIYGYKGTEVSQFSRSVLDRSNFKFAQDIAQPYVNGGDFDEIIHNIAPFIKKSLYDGKLCDVIDGHSLWSFIKKGSMCHITSFMDQPAFVALNTAGAIGLVHRVRDKSYKCAPWLVTEFGIAVMPDFDPLPGGFPDLPKEPRRKTTVRFCKVEDIRKVVK